MNKILIFSILISIIGTAKAQKSEERKAILSMAGTYEVKFDFAETFSPDTAYKFAERYHANAMEMVIITENSENKISLNHFLLVKDSIVIKHWRQDWIYENKEFLDYKGNNTWTKRILSVEEVAGTWTQKVFQIDESPRYEAFGKFTKENNEWVWVASCNSPLPRRELLVREDYTIMKRRSRIVIGANYWYLEQDNKKMNGEQLLCHEKGMEVFTHATFDSSHIVKWWAGNEKTWRLIALEWNDMIMANKSIRLEGNLMTSNYQKEVFKFIKELNSSNKDEKEIRKAIRQFIKKNCEAS